MSYTGRDIAAIRKELINLVPKLTDKWTDFNESDLGMVLIELMAGNQDMQNFYLDTQTFETYLDTAVQDKNVRALLRSMNYKIPMAQSAECIVRIVFTNDDLRNIIIPRFTSFTSSTNLSVINYVAKETTIKTGQFDYIDVPVIEGIARTITYTKDDLVNNINTDGDNSRRLYLGYKNVAEGTVTINQEGEVWTECEDSLLKYEGGRWYSVHVDSDGQVYVLMSVNYLDLIGTGTKISIEFVTTQGTRGTILTDTIDTVNLDIADVQRIYNTTKSYGAVDNPSSIDLQNMKILARRNAITMGRYITLEDFELGVYKQPYVYTAVVKDWKYPDYVNTPYTVKVWAVDYNGDSLGELKKQELKNHLESRSIADVSVEIIEVVNVNFDIEAKIVVQAADLNSREKIRQDVQNYITMLYRAENMSFGDRISYSLLNSRILAYSDAIKDVQVISPAADVKVGNIEFPKLGKVNIKLVEEL
jgi:hypothetical protein|nr:MAG TPA: baseplate wedge protein [Bacteriophage sp.]